MDLFTSNDLEICLIDAKTFTSDSIDADEVSQVVAALLQKLTSTNGHQEAQVLSQIAQYVKDLAILHSAVCTILLDSLDQLKQPAPFLDILPEIFSSAPAESIAELAQKLFEFASSDYLFVRALAVLVELPLDSQLSKTTMKLASRAIQTIAPEEYPTLFRVTLKAANGPHGRDIIHAWRRKLQTVESSQLGMVLDTVWTLLCSADKAVLEWLQQISVDSSKGVGRAAHQMPAVDLIVLLHCMSSTVTNTSSSSGGNNNSVSGARRCAGLLHSLLDRGVFPWGGVVQLLEGQSPGQHRQNEIWSKLHAPVWSLCVWLLEQVTVYQYTTQHYIRTTSPINTINTTYTDTATSGTSIHTSNCVTLLTLLVCKLFGAAPILRESIVSTLTVLCFPQIQSHGVSSTNGTSGKISGGRTISSRTGTVTSTHTTHTIPLPPLGTAHATLSHTTTHPITTTYTEARHYRRATLRTHSSMKQTLYTQASSASSMLLYLSGVYSVVGEKIGRVVYDRVAQQLSENGKTFPSPVVCMRILQCAAMGASTSTQQESALLILVQKLISTLHTTADQNCLLSTLFTASTNYGSFSISASYNTSRSVLSSERKLLKMGSVLPLCMYNASTFGIVFAGQLLLREYSMYSGVDSRIGRMYGSSVHSGTGTSSNSSSATHSTNTIHTIHTTTPVSMQDRRALVTWIAQCSTLSTDVSGLYALDVLSVCLYCAIENSNNDNSGNNAMTSNGTSSNSSSNSSSTNHKSASSTTTHDVEYVQHLYTALHTVYHRVCQGFALSNRPCHQSLPDVGDYHYCVLHLTNTINTATNTINNTTSIANTTPITPTVYSISDLSTLLVHSTLPAHLAYSTRNTHVVHALHEVVEIGSVVYSMVQRVAYAQCLLHSTNTTTTTNTTTSNNICIRLSFPTDDRPHTTHHTHHAHQTSTDIILDSTQSHTKLAEWSCGADESMCGVFELKAGWSAEQALKLAWERGLVVAVLVGTAQALYNTNNDTSSISNTTANNTTSSNGDSNDSSSGFSCRELVLTLLCQLHTSRLMLRAAHTRAILTKTRIATSNSTNKTNINSGGGGRGRGGRGGKSSGGEVIHSSGRASGSHGTSRGSSGSPRGGARGSGGRGYADSSPQAAKETAEFVEELQLNQRLTLQRLLTRSVSSVPFKCMLDTLHSVLIGSGVCSNSGSGGGSGNIPMDLMTDVGLALVSQFVYRVSQQGPTSTMDGGSTMNSDSTGGSIVSSTNTYDTYNATDRFVSLFDVYTTPRTTHTTAHATLQYTLVVRLLALLPALLDWLRDSREALEEVFSGSVSTTSSNNNTTNSSSGDKHISTTGNSAPYLGAALDRHGCKLLVLSLFALLELTIPRILHATLLHTLAQSIEVYETSLRTNEKGVFGSFVNSGVSGGVSGSDKNSGIYKRSKSVSTVYGALERRLLQQHDSTVVSAGLRCLYVLLSACGIGSSSSISAGNSGSNSGNSSSKDSVCCRLASVSWVCARNIYSECTNLATHMLHTTNNSTTNTSTTHTLYSVHQNTMPVPGMDEIWLLLVHTVTNQHYTLHHSLQQLYSRCTKKTDAVVSLFKTSFNTRSDTNTTKSAYNNTDALHCAAYRLYYSVWWSSELCSARVYGVSIVLREIFKLLLSDSPTSSTINTSTTTSNKHKKQKVKHNDSSDESEPEFATNTSSARTATTTKTTTNTTTTSKRPLAPEYLLHTYTTTSTTDSNKFGVLFLSHETVEFHLSVMLPLLPALFLLAEPSASGGGGLSNGSSGVSGASMITPYYPYTSFVHTCMLFQYLIQQLQYIMEDQLKPLQLVLHLAPLLAKVCRAVLVAVDAAIAHAAHWRNAQTQIDFREVRARDAMHSTSYAPTELDVGSVDYFEQMLQHALHVTQAVSLFAQTFKSLFILSGAFVVPKILLTVVPALITASDVYMSRIFNTAKIHSCVLSTEMYKSGTTSTGNNSTKNSKSSSSGNNNTTPNTTHTIGDKCMLVCMREFLARHDATVLNPLTSDELYNIMGTNNTTNSGDTAGDSNTNATAGTMDTNAHTTHNSYNNNEYNASDSEDSAGFDGFQAITNSSNSGWGLYTINDNNDSTDDHSEYSTGEYSGTSGGSGRGGVNNRMDTLDDQSVQSQYSNRYSDGGSDLFDFNSDDEFL